MERNKGVVARQSYKTAIDKTEDQLRKEALKSVTDDERLCEEAYKLAVKSTYLSAKEFVYPYIQSSSLWILPIEQKYANLTADDIIPFYLRGFTDPNFFPKDCYYYQNILSYTGSIYFDSKERSAGNDWAYSKAIIKRILLPEQWDGDLYRQKEMIPDTRNPNIRAKTFFNYFDYIKAWDIAFYYDNRQKKHSWFITLKREDGIKFPQWFFKWFSEWGSYPIIFPQKIKGIYEDFKKSNPSLKNHHLYFCALYNVPWIVKWDVVINHRSVEKFGESTTIPYLGRRILIKWWDKYKFFEDSVFSVKGIICLEPVKRPEPPQEDVSELLIRMLSEGTSSKNKTELKKLKAKLKAMLGDSSDEEEETQPMEQDSQDPNEDNEDDGDDGVEQHGIPLKGVNF